MALHASPAHSPGRRLESAAAGCRETAAAMSVQAPPCTTEPALKARSTLSNLLEYTITSSSLLPAELIARFALGWRSSPLVALAVRTRRALLIESARTYVACRSRHLPTVGPRCWPGGACKRTIAEGRRGSHAAAIEAPPDFCSCPRNDDAVDHGRTPADVPGPHAHCNSLCSRISPAVFVALSPFPKSFPLESRMRPILLQAPAAAS